MGRYLALGIRERRIAVADLERLRVWARSEPEAPEGAWYKDFGSFKLCGEGRYARPEPFLAVSDRGFRPDAIR
jgi:hypothetical protein